MTTKKKESSINKLNKTSVRSYSFYYKPSKWKTHKGTLILFLLCKSKPKFRIKRVQKDTRCSVSCQCSLASSLTYKPLAYDGTKMASFTMYILAGEITPVTLNGRGQQGMAGRDDANGWIVIRY